MAAVVGRRHSTRQFGGAEFNEVDRDILFAHARSEDRAAEMEDRFVLYKSIIAAEIPGWDMAS